MTTRVLSVHKEHEFLQKMEDAGLNEELAQAVVQSKGNELAGKIVVFIQRGGYETTTSQRRAKEIIGRNMLDMGDVMQHFRVVFSDEQKIKLSNIPWSESVLQECKDTHILFPGFPLTLLDIRGRMPRGHFYFYEDAWYNTEDFVKEEKVGCRWYLIRKEAVSDSFNKTFQEQEKLISSQEEVPYAREAVFGIMLLERVTGEHLFKNVYVRCRDLDSGGCRVYVGYFGSYGLDVSGGGDDDRDDGLGLAAERKFPS